jgi:hypothetical protein
MCGDFTSLAIFEDTEKVDVHRHGAVAESDPVEEISDVTF